MLMLNGMLRDVDVEWDVILNNRGAVRNIREQLLQQAH